MDQWTPPKGSADAAAWKQHYLRLCLKRFVVVDNAMSEGGRSSSIVMELVGQEMGEGEGRTLVRHIPVRRGPRCAGRGKRRGRYLRPNLDDSGQPVKAACRVSNICDPMKDVPGWLPTRTGTG